MTDTRPVAFTAGSMRATVWPRWTFDQDRSTWRAVVSVLRWLQPVQPYCPGEAWDRVGHDSDDGGTDRGLTQGSTTARRVGHRALERLEAGLSVGCREPGKRQRDSLSGGRRALGTPRRQATQRNLSLCVFRGPPKPDKVGNSGRLSLTLRPLRIE